MLVSKVNVHTNLTKRQKLVDCIVSLYVGRKYSLSELHYAGFFSFRYNAIESGSIRFFLFRIWIYENKKCRRFMDIV